MPSPLRPMPLKPLIALSIAVSCHCTPVLAQDTPVQDAPETITQPEAPAPEPAPAPTPAEFGAVVEDSAADRASRLRAAQTLIQRGATRESLVIVNAILGRTTEADSGARIILAAMSAEPVVPGELWPPVSLLPVGDDASLRSLVAAAAGSFRTRDAAALLVEWAERDPDPQVRAAARAALIRLSGRTPPNEPEVWDEWLESQGAVDGLAWLRGLIQGLAARADGLSRKLDSAETQLVQAYRRLHLALPQDQRSALLASLLGDPIPRLRQLGFDLVDRELASSVQLDESVGLAAVGLIEDDDPAVRRRAALLVVRLAPETGAHAITERLRREPEASVAEALLRGVTRWPSEGCERQVTRWALADGITRDAALDTAWSLHRAGVFTDEHATGDLLEEIRLRETATLNASAMRLLSALGTPADRARLAALLEQGDAATRRRAAEAVVADPDSTDAVIKAATSDTGLYDLAARAIGQHRRDARGLRALIALPPPSIEAGAAAISTLCESLPTRELVEGVEPIKDPAQRERLLTRMLSAPESPDRTRALVVLSEARLELDRPAEALLTLDAIAPSETPPSQRRLDARTTALLALGRVADASALGGSADAWLSGLDRSIGSPHAEQVHQELTTRFAGALSDSQAQRLAGLRQRLSSAGEHGEATAAEDAP